MRVVWVRMVLIRVVWVRMVPNEWFGSGWSLVRVVWVRMALIRVVLVRMVPYKSGLGQDGS